MHEVKSFGPGEIDLALAVQLVGLIHRAWPRTPPVEPEAEAQQRIKSQCEYAGPEAEGPMWHAVIEDGRGVASASTFPRRIKTEQGEITILGLAGVVVDESRRGRGYGRLVVQRAFERVDQGVFPFAIYQTEPHNRAFYNKLGAMLIDNPVVNSKAPEGPDTPAFWDPLVFVYPADRDWPGGVIDMLGPGY